MKELELSAKNLVRMAKVIVGLSDLYDNEESVKGCYECHDIFYQHSVSYGNIGTCGHIRNYTGTDVVLL